MLAPGRASYEGRHVHVRGAVNEPKGIQDHIPLIVGGNGPRRTAGLAVRFADELNFTYIGAAETAELMASARERCEAAGRNPDEPALLAVHARRRRPPGSGTRGLPGRPCRARPRPRDLLPDALGTDRGDPGALRRGLRRRQPSGLHQPQLVAPAAIVVVVPRGHNGFGANVPVVFGEPERLAQWSGSSRPVASELIRVECLRTVDRARLSERLAESEVARLRADLITAVDSFTLLRVSAAVLARAAEPFPTLVGTLDAIHLSSALLAREQIADLKIATHDRELEIAARALGFEVLV